MLPILTKPLLQYGVEEALSSGINNMAIITGRGKRAISDHFDHSFELESQLEGTSKESKLSEIKEIIDNATFTYTRQKKILGLGHAILSGEPLISNETFAVILADDLCVCENEGVIAQMIEVYNQFQCSVVAIQEVPMNQTHNYGIISGTPINNSINTYQVNDMIEKPDLKNAPSNMAIIGRYILTPDIFDILKKIKPGKNGEIQITDALNILAKKEKVIAYKFNGKRFDCGSIKGYVNATNFLAKKEGIT
jgi:UTP--glucose-1-phosphate uridylyltransferase